MVHQLINFVPRKAEDTPFVSTTISLPTVSISEIPMSIRLRLPAFGHVKRLLPLKYILRNRTAYVQEVKVNMESSDVFLLSGIKEVFSS